MLRHKDGGAAIGEEARIRRLVIVHGVGKGHEDARHARRGELGDRHSAGTADDQISLGIAPRHVVDEPQELAVYASAGVLLAQCRKMLFARLVHHGRPLFEKRKRTRHRFVQRLGGAGASAATAPAPAVRAAAPGLAPGRATRSATAGRASSWPARAATHRAADALECLLHLLEAQVFVIQRLEFLESFLQRAALFSQEVGHARPSISKG